MTLPRKPAGIAKLEALVKIPIVVEGYTLETVTGDRPEIIAKLQRLHIERIRHFAELAMWRRPKKTGKSSRKQRDARRR